MFHPSIIWRLLFMHRVCMVFCLALVRAGSSSAARMAMMAMTTNNSIRVNPRRLVPTSQDFGEHSTESGLPTAFILANQLVSTHESPAGNDHFTPKVGPLTRALVLTDNHQMS